MPIIREKDIHKYIDKKVIMQENKYTTPFNRTDVKGGAFYNAKRIYEGNGYYYYQIKRIKWYY